MQSQPLHDDEHEQALLKRELDAFERRQRALNEVTGKHRVHDNGRLQPDKGASPSRTALDEFRAADAEWRAAREDCERVVDEIGLAS
jgi:ParB-like chromosome segregation protein Spo0J